MKKPKVSKKKPTEKQLQNLKPPFKKGGNIPKSPGRPPIPESEKKAKELLKSQSEELVIEMVKDGSYKNTLKRTLAMAAENGSIAPIKYLNDLMGNKIEEEDVGKQIVIQTMNIF